jgi:hypothetical protein
MFTITLKRPLGILAITAGLLVAAGSAGASQVAPHPAPLSYTLNNTMISGYS